MWAGTCLSANLPPITAWAKIGSVGVTPAAITSEARNVRSGIRPQISRAEIIHPHSMHGPRRKKSDRQCRFMYAFPKHQDQRFLYSNESQVTTYLGQFNADGEYGYSNDNASEFQCNVIRDLFLPPTPSCGIEKIEAMGTNDDADYSCYRCFADIELLFDKQTDHAKDDHKAAEERVCEMGGIDFKGVESSHRELATSERDTSGRSRVAGRYKSLGGGRHAYTRLSLCSGRARPWCSDSKEKGGDLAAVRWN